jgi:hypothetical protein
MKKGFDTLALFIVVMIGCGGGDGEGDSRDQDNTRDGSSNTSCSGFAPNIRVSELDSQQLEEACNGYRECYANNWTDEEKCRSLAATTARFGETPVSTDSELQSLCTQLYEACLKDPKKMIEDQSPQPVSPCAKPEQCTATIAQLDACAADLREQSHSVFPACKALTLAMDLGETDSPDSCNNLGGDCIVLLVTPSSE